MESILRTSRSSALIGFAFAIPLALILIVEISGIQPFYGFFVSITTSQGVEPRLNLLGKAITLGALFLLPLGLAVTLTPIAKNLRRQGPASSRVNLAIAGLLSLFLVVIVAASIIDQYPCWIGVPNCD
jgi:hypothetical protein